MTRIVIKKLIWDEWNREHIKKHNVSVDEAEEAVNNLIAHKKGKKGRFIAIGRSGTRIISVLVGRKETGVYYVATARDSDKKERRLVYEKEKN